VPRDRLAEVPGSAVCNHPSVAAWVPACPGARIPHQIFVLKPETKRSAVFRLEAAGPDGSPVIAKRGRAARLATELYVYRQILPQLSCRTLRCYGSVEDPQSGYAWLFLEDAGEQRYSADSAEHRALAGRWLGLLHRILDGQTAAQGCLPARGVDYYRETVALARETVWQSIDNKAFTPADRATLEALLSACAVVESRWGAVEDLFVRVPHTLVHGDFSAKNVRVRVGLHGLELLPLDWDSAGWGVAAPDLSQADIGVYWSVVHHTWPWLGCERLSELATIGTLFLALEWITGEAEPLRGDWVDGVMRKMRAYASEVTRALKIAAWTCW
jgi:Phosphotransferase enzyme family